MSRVKNGQRSWMPYEQWKRQLKREGRWVEQNVRKQGRELRQRGTRKAREVLDDAVREAVRRVLGRFK